MTGKERDERERRDRIGKKRRGREQEREDRVKSNM